MAKSNEHEFEGTVQNIMGNNNYRVLITSTGGSEREVLCHLSGKMRQYKIKVLVGDEVRVTVPPPYELGRITFRGRKKE